MRSRETECTIKRTRHATGQTGTTFAGQDLHGDQVTLEVRGWKDITSLSLKHTSVEAGLAKETWASFYLDTPANRRLLAEALRDAAAMIEDSLKR